MKRLTCAFFFATAFCFLCMTVLAADHVWSSPAFNWNMDLTAAVVEQTCSDCGEMRTFTPFLQRSTTDATCSQGGYTTVTAMIDIDGRIFEDERQTDFTPQLAHQYDAPSFSWNLLTMTCIAHLHCTVGDETRYEECTVTLSDDQTEYIASVTVDDHTYTSTQKIKHEHAYGDPVFRWSSDYTSATAYAVCADCKDDDPEKEISVPCNVTAVIPPSCADDPTAAYTAGAIMHGIYFEEHKTVGRDRTDHIYSLPDFVWKDNACDAHYICTLCENTFITPCTIEEKDEFDNCTDPGRHIRTAAITLNGKTYADSKETPLPAKGHTEKRIEGYDADCTEEGLTDGFICAECGAVLLEQSPIEPLGHTELTVKGITPTCIEGGVSDGAVCKACGITVREQTALPASGHTPDAQDAIAPTCTEDGNTGHVFCAVCSVHLQNPTQIPALGHVFGAAEFTWSQNADSVTAQKSCIHDCGMTLSGDIKQATSEHTQNGILYTTVTATATFDDGTTAVDQKVIRRGAVVIEPTPTHSFSDVIRGAYYEQAVLWAASVGITQGTSATTFSPDMDCTRAQIVTMLWRAAGCPIPTEKTVFTDVPSDAYYAQAVAWAAQTGITQGTSQMTFSPDMPCSRAQIVTMLWRAKGSPKPRGNVPFSDVAADDWYRDAVAWAVEQGITQGTGNDCFSPEAVCTRAQIVTFLYRASRK